MSLAEACLPLEVAQNPVQVYAISIGSLDEEVSPRLQGSASKFIPGSLFAYRLGCDKRRADNLYQ